MKYTRSLFQQLGDCTYQLETLKGQRTRLNVTAPVGRLLENWGVPRGDKHLHPNYRLPETIRHGKPEVKRAYIAEVIPEDGFFVERNKQMKFGIKRAHILDAGPKTDVYDYQAKITNEHKDLIRLYGREHTRTIRSDKPRKEFYLTKGQLHMLATDVQDPNDSFLLQQLKDIVYENPCKLLEDEKELIQSLGIQMATLFKTLILHETSRVSAIWEIYTETEDDTYRWATYMPPSSGEKQDSAKEWVSEYQKKDSDKSNKSKRHLNRSLKRVV